MKRLMQTKTFYMSNRDEIFHCNESNCQRPSFLSQQLMSHLTDEKCYELLHNVVKVEEIIPYKKN